MAARPGISLVAYHRQVMASISDGHSARNGLLADKEVLCRPILKEKHLVASQPGEVQLETVKLSVKMGSSRRAASSFCPRQSLQIGKESVPRRAPPAACCNLACLDT